MPLGSIIILIGVVCIIAAIVGGGLKLTLPSGGGVDAPVVQSLRRQLLLAIFGALLIAGGAAANGNLPISAWISPQPAQGGDHATPPPATGKQAIAPEKPAASGPTGEAAKPRPNAGDNGPTSNNPDETAAATPEAQTGSAAGTTADPVCAQFSGLTPEEWRARYLHSPDAGTWHVYVLSLAAGSSRDDAEAAAGNWRERFRARGLDFDPIKTVNWQTGQNERWGLLITSGVSSATANSIARFADRCGVAKGAFAVMMH